MYIYGHSLYAVPPVAPGAVPFLPLWQQYQAGFQPSRNQSPADDKRAQMCFSALGPMRGSVRSNKYAIAHFTTVVLAA